MWIVGSVVTLLTLSLGALYLWRNGPYLAAWDAFNVIIPLGFVATIYLWSYDQLLYVIPIVWIAMKSVEVTKSYIFAFLFLLILDVLSLFALALQANTHQDLLAIISTVLILGLCLMLQRVKDQQTNRIGIPS
jgi:ABC-type Co2+ transport system permease subunit